MASETTICNIALSWLGADPILTLQDGTVNGNLCLANYAELRDSTLEAAAWTFATRRYAWTPVSDVPEYGYSAKFLIPSEVLRVIECRENNDYVANGISNLDWRKEGQFVVSNSAVVYAKCIVQVVPANDFSPLFRQTLSALIAATLSPTITESKKKTDQMWDKFNSYIKRATAMDGSQGRNDRIRAPRYIEVR